MIGENKIIIHRKGDSDQAVNNKRISFDFDGTLQIDAVQDFASELIRDGFEVWITTTRYEDSKKDLFPYNPTNQDLYKVAMKLGIPHHRIQFTNMELKYRVLDGFLFHIDDQFIELKHIEEHTNTKGVFIGMGNDWRVDINKIIKGIT